MRKTLFCLIHCSLFTAATAAINPDQLDLNVHMVNTLLSQEYSVFTNDAGLLCNIDNINNKNSLLIPINNNDKIILKLSGLLDLGGFWQSNQDYINNNINYKSSGLNYNGWLTLQAILNSAISTQLTLSAQGSTASQQPANLNFYAQNLNDDNTQSNINIDEAFIDVHRLLNNNLLALRVGRAYLPFGVYDRNAILPPLTQQLSEENASLIEMSLLTSNISNFNNLYGTAYIANKNNTNNGGLTVGLANHSNNNIHSVDYNISLGVINNLLDINSLNEITTALADHANSNIPGLALHTMLGAGPFTVGADYITALNKSNVADLYRLSNNQIVGAQPEAAVLSSSYRFNTFGQSSAIDISYQRSWQANLLSPDIDDNLLLALPKSRIAAGYKIVLFSHTVFNTEVNYDKAYSINQGGTGQHNILILGRVIVVL